MTEEVLKACNLCPRRCLVDRAAGKYGVCGAGAQLRVYRYGPHFGEEPPISGDKGSGTVFFSHCTLKCLYCQNYPWSQQGQGEDISVSRLTEIFSELYEKGCHNWNLVTATQWLPFVREAAAPLIAAGRKLPFVFNTSGYETIDTLEEYGDLIDIALTDLRYSTSALARRGSAAADYVEMSRRALLWFCGRLGPLDVDDDGIAKRGVICRLLVLPGHPEEAIDNLRWIAENIGTELDVSIMSQYTPVYRACDNGEFSRKVTEDEYTLVTDEAERLGFENGWIQPYESDASDAMVGCEMTAGEGTVR